MNTQRNNSAPTIRAARRTRGALTGVRQILIYNWPFYVVAGLTVVFAAAAALALAPGYRFALALFLSPVVFWFVASIIVSLWVYDLSKLTRWSWIGEVLPRETRSFVNLHAGLDEVGDALPELFPAGRGLTVDFYDAREMGEPSIERARRREALFPRRRALAVAAKYDALPLANESCEAALLVFAAHELRRPAARRRLFGELRRALARGGRLLVVEHARDWRNFAAYGPGFWHFLPVAEWRRAGREANLRLAREFKITPFVRVFLFEKTG